jgi:hypothetical protein
MGLFGKGAEYEDVVYFVDHRDAVTTINRLPDGARRHESVLLFHTPAGITAWVIQDLVEGDFWSPKGTKPTESRGTISLMGMGGRTKASVGGIGLSTRRGASG